MVTKYGFRDQYSLEHSGKFICTDTGLYLIVVDIMLKGSDSPFYIRRNEHDLTTVLNGSIDLHKNTTKHPKTHKKHIIDKTTI
jgi:hypothetical protein